MKAKNVERNHQSENEKIPGTRGGSDGGARMNSCSRVQDGSVCVFSGFPRLFFSVTSETPPVRRLWAFSNFATSSRTCCECIAEGLDFINIDWESWVCFNLWYDLGCFCSFVVELSGQKWEKCQKFISWARLLVQATLKKKACFASGRLFLMLMMDGKFYEGTQRDRRK